LRIAVALLSVILLGACRTAPQPPEEIALSLPYEVDTIDPHARNRLSNFAPLSNFYEPLVMTDVNMSIKPCLADRWDNPDYTTWVFHLRPGVRFHDGAPLTAEDVVFSFQRLLSSKSLEMSGYIWNVTSVRATGATTVEIKTPAPMSILLNKLRFVHIVRKGATPASLLAGANGTGPYRFVSWKPNEEIVMARNDGYWGGKPAMARVVLRLARSPDQALEDLVSGRSQLVQGNTKALEEAARKAGDVTVFRNNSIFVKFLGYDLKHEKTPFASTATNPFRDPRVREAIDLTIDRPRLVARLSTFAVPATQAVPPFIFGYNPALAPPPHDLEKARALMREAGFADGFAVTLHVRKMFAEAARVVAEMLAELRVRVTVEEVSDPRFFEIAAGHKASFFFNRFGCPTGDASDILENAVHSADEARHFGKSNDGEFSDPEIDALIEESAGILDM
jgi:peptide/nickel transport system substrate-binding protein